MNPQKSPENQKIIDAYDYLSTAACTQDLTGLIPAAPATDAELESYESISHFLPPDGDPGSIHPESSSGNHK